MTSITECQKDKQDRELYKALDKGIEAMEKGRVLSHEEAMQKLRERSLAATFSNL